MVGDARHGTDLHVARRRHLEVDLMVEDELGERAEHQRAVVGDRGVGGEAHAVADTVGALGDRVGDQRQVRRLAGVDRHVQVDLAGEGAGLGVQRRRESRLRAGEVERDDLVVRVAQPVDELRDLQRAVLGAHRAADRVDGDRPAVGGGVGLAASETARDGVDDRVEREPGGDVQLGREPDLGVDHAVGGEVDRRLVGDPLDRLRPLHHGERVLERGQVLQEVGGLGAGGEPALQRVDVGRRQASSRSRRRARSRSAAAALRRDDRAAAPSAPASPARASDR